MCPDGKYPVGNNDIKERYRTSAVIQGLMAILRIVKRRIRGSLLILIP